MAFLSGSPLPSRLPRSPLGRRSFCIAAASSASGSPKIVVTGANGFIGSALVKRLALTRPDTEVVALVRSATAADAAGSAISSYAFPSNKRPENLRIRPWAANKLSAVGDDWLGWEKELSGPQTSIINLAGAPVVSRWTPAGKREIMASRVGTTTAIAEAVKSMDPAERPGLFVATSAVGYYGSFKQNEGPEFSESDAVGGGFAAEVCKTVEETANSLFGDIPETRLVTIRNGVVLGSSGGAISRMLPFYKAFIGGPVGSGKQMVSWISLEDCLALMEAIVDKKDMSGVYNVTAPTPVTMGDMCASLARSLSRPNLFPVPELPLKVMFGDGASIVLEGQTVLPTRALESGFEFKHKNIDQAMEWLVKQDQ